MSKKAYTFFGFATLECDDYWTRAAGQIRNRAAVYDQLTGVLCSATPWTYNSTSAVYLHSYALKDFGDVCGNKRLRITYTGQVYNGTWYGGAVNEAHDYSKVGGPTDVLIWG